MASRPPTVAVAVNKENLILSNTYERAASLRGIDMVRHPDDPPSAGIILCKSKSGLVAEYSLRDGKPIGVSEYRLTSRLPEGLSGQLPSPQELAGVLEEVEVEGEVGNEG